jgi:hypothetical protein
MFDILKSIIWVAGALIVAYYIMGFLGYEINYDYFTYSKDQCEQKLENCKDQLIRKGTEGAECDFNCIDPKLIINKKK